MILVLSANKKNFLRGQTIMEQSKFIKKFVGTTFKNISSRGFLMKLYYYIIDSKQRTRMRVDTFLREQVENPDIELWKIAVNIRNEFPNPDLRIVEILKFVYKNVKYSYDSRNFGKVEYWASAIKTWKRKRDDCDGINALIFVLARLSGISPLQLWSAIGDTTVGGHYWLIYFSFKTDKWSAIDGTYNVNLRPVSLRTEFRLRATRYKTTWCIFNDLWSYVQR